jgi:hypothetical protein
MIPAISEYWIRAATVPAVSGAQVCGFILVVITERTKCGITRCNMHDFGSPACKPTIVGSLWSQERFGPGLRIVFRSQSAGDRGQLRAQLSRSFLNEVSSREVFSFWFVLALTADLRI